MTEQEWIKIETEFKKWDEEGNFGASQRQILDWFKAKFFSPTQSELLVNFLIHLNEKGLINNHDFEYEKEVKKYLTNC